MTTSVEIAAARISLLSNSTFPEKEAMKSSAQLESETLTLEQLIQLHDEVFVIRAYEAVLGRPPDPGGQANYLAQVRAGVHKAHIVAELALSPEGELKSSDFPGLRGAIALHRKRTPSFWDRLVQRLARASMADTERQLRVIENKLYVMEQGLIRQSMLLTDLLTFVRDSTLPLAKPVSHSSKGISDFQSPSLSYLSPKVGRTFEDLKAAIAVKHAS